MMPSEVLQYCLDAYIEDYKSQPCFGVVKTLKLSEVYETMVEGKMF